MTQACNRLLSERPQERSGAPGGTKAPAKHQARPGASRAPGAGRIKTCGAAARDSRAGLHQTQKGGLWIRRLMLLAFFCWSLRAAPQDWRISSVALLLK